MAVEVTSTLVATNRVLNPTPVDISNYGYGTANGTLVMEDGALKYTSTSGTSQCYAIGPNQLVPAKKNDIVEARFDYRGPGDRVAIWHVCDSAGAIVQQIHASIPATNEWTEVICGGTVTADAAASVRFVQIIYGSSAAGYGSHHIRRVIVHPVNESGPYFDGDTPDKSGFEYVWTGTPHASTSEKRQLTYEYTPDPLIYTEDRYRARFLDPVVHTTRRVDIYERDGSVLWSGAGTDPRLISGAVSIDYSRDERRSLDCELENFDKALVHQPSGFWYDKVLKAYRGIRFRDENGEWREYEEPLGKFLIDRVNQPRFPNTVKITARDQTKKCMLSKFRNSLYFLAGTSITEIIGALAANSGIFDRILPDTDEVLGSDTVFESGTSRWEAMKQIATAFNYELFFDAYGYLVMRKYLDPTLSPIGHEFLTGSEAGNLVDWEKSNNDTSIYNVVVVTGSSDAAIPVSASAENNSPDSPTSTVNIGERVYPFQSDMITTQAQAQELADTLLSVNALESYEINMTSLVTLWLEAGDIVRFVDPDATEGEPDRFLLTSISIPLGLEAMTASGRRLTIIGYNYA